MTRHAKIIGRQGHGIVSRINGALDFSEKLLATSPTYARANPQITERIKKIKGQNRQYLAHEYFNRDWLPMHFATMAQWLDPAKLDFACSAHFLDHIDMVNFTPDQQAFLKEIPDSMFRESVWDFMVNQQFRRDYWVKGLRRLNPLEQAEGLRSLSVILVSPRPDISLKVTGALGEATMNETVYVPVLEYIADHKPRTIGQIEQAIKERGVGFAQVMQAVMVLTGAGHLASVQPHAVIAKARKNTDRINEYLINKARGSNDLSYLASPVTGGGVAVGRFSQLFLMALSSGEKQPEEWAQTAWQLLAGQGQKLVKEGKTLENTDENLAELTAQARVFAERQLPLLKALQII